MYLVGVGFVCNVLTPKIDKNNFDYNIKLKMSSFKGNISQNLQKQKVEGLGEREIGRDLRHEAGDTRELYSGEFESERLKNYLVA